MLAHGRRFSPATPASSTTKTGRHDIAEILLKVASNTKIQIKINQSTGESYLGLNTWSCPAPFTVADSGCALNGRSLSVVIYHQMQLYYIHKLVSKLKFDFCCIFFFSISIHKHLTTSCLGSCHVTFHSSLTIQSNSRQLNILFNQKSALGVYSDFIPKDLVDSLLISQLRIWTLTWPHREWC